MVVNYNPFGEGTGDILLGDVYCRGNETSLADCRHAGWGVHQYCGQSYRKDVAIMCVDNVTITGNKRKKLQFIQTLTATCSE